MSEHNNIADPHEQNCELLAILWDGMKRKGDWKCYSPCTQCKGFKMRRIKITTTKRHCREYGCAKGEHHYYPLVSFSLYMSLY